MWSIATQMGIATTTVSFSESMSWFGVGLWGLVFFSAGGLILTAIRGRNGEPPMPALKEPKAPFYRQAA